MYRCLELAKLGAGYSAPNPMVGAVLVYEDRIVGEGWHRYYGESHAEVNCIASVKEDDRHLIPLSTLYVSLEPCAHFGKTPPCADLIIKNKIPKVIIGCPDPFKEVDGKGIEKLKREGVKVEVGILEKECKDLNKRFFTFHTLHRPYVILKWAETGDGKMGAPTKPPPKGGGAYNSSESSRLLISNEYSNRLVHKWRSEEAGILVGTNTAMMDDPELTTRLWTGPSPIRIVVDMNLKLPSSLKVFDQQARTIIFNTLKQEENGNTLYYQVTNDSSLVHQIMDALYQLKIQSVLVEGGAKLLQSFIDEGVWDEARVISNGLPIAIGMEIGNGLKAPQLGNAIRIEEKIILSDTIEIFNPKK